MKRILFVDDEPAGLRALRRMIQARRKDWDMAFVSSGADALAELERRSYDVVVADMYMPHMDGAELLLRVREQYPRIARIILSGYASPPLQLRAASVAHRFLWKPCPSDELVEALEQAASVQDLVKDERLRDLLGGMDSLPALPSTYARIRKALYDPACSVHDIADIIVEDPGMAAKVLQLVNSAFFGLPRRISSIAHAVGYLGLQRIRDLVLTVGIFRALSTEDVPQGVSLDALRDSALEVATLAQRIHPDRRQRDDVFTAGLLHDIGWLVAFYRFPEESRAVLAQVADGQAKLLDAEREVFGVSHGDMGAYLLALWGLDANVIETVRFHHRPADVPHDQFAIVDAVHVAVGLLGVRPGIELLCAMVLDEEHLERLGMTGQLSSWRSMAEDVARVGFRSPGR